MELILCSDPHTRLRPGDRGTVTLVDALGTVHVKWDDGSTLGLIPGEDNWRILQRTPEERDDCEPYDQYAHEERHGPWE